MIPVCVVSGCGGYTEIQMRGPHYCRVCVKCGEKQHKDWLPKSDAGIAVRSVQSTHKAIKPKDRARILERAGARCEICGAVDVLLNVGHFLSVADGIEAGLSDAEINSDENLFCACEECNFGQGKKPVSLKILVAIIRARCRRE